MLRIITPYFIIMSGLMHLFCCGLPLLLSITSLTAAFGVSSLSIVEVEWFELIEKYVLLMSGGLLVVTYLINYSSKKLDCLEQGVCVHPPCEDKKNTSYYMLRIAIVLYTLNIITLLFMH